VIRSFTNLHWTRPLVKIVRHRS